MLFNSFVFAGIFLPAMLLLFWAMPNAQAKRGLLLLGSLVFYGYWVPIYLLLLLTLVGVAWWCAVQAEHSRGRWPVMLAALLLLGSLGYYKYAGFLGVVAQDLAMWQTEYRVPQLALPLGISFIAFQALGYVIDVSRGQFPAERRYTMVLLFKAFFPQLIAGPICRAHELMPQLQGEFKFRQAQFASGLAIFSIGFLLKAFFADGLAPHVDQLYTQSHFGFYDAMAAAIGFGGQIYADFWGYSTMAVGLARMFAVDIPINFNLPYLSTSLREFWRRWHITLSEWLRDYLYKPLGGSRHGPMRMVLALMITMLLGGLWHGANYTFLIWGAIHGGLLVLEHLLGARQIHTHHTSRFSYRNFLGWLYTLIAVFATWVFFRADNVHQALEIFTALAQPRPESISGLPNGVRQILLLALLLFLLQFPIERLLARLRREMVSDHIAVAVAFWAIIASVILGAPQAEPFIYFQF